ncbi:Acyl carrier protein phosphodiesterase [Salinimicrobium catena]|uniref:Acyl carrier protein phosphodiesterase n=1 Tax=Salinimicrobium catena TaxID=390640 RepID=A0A1H5LHQ3_9FLAO|nr:acyl carrier protein phosphodiesterase [Salinimicrobium catena]SDL10205.1 Acyl carrier protein phosphodiesterase [Salinimicrobium catena]SEE76576.1 Acyl carrier protein phosphodiesterase [Salinimicrobium catena]
MNFLAHIYLSGKDEELTVGNFIADSIKGRKYLDYPPGIQKGILLHRAIDTYTDAHPVVRKSAGRLYKNYSHYSPVIVDIFYDHFLASNWSYYSDRPLEDFIADFYLLLKKRFSILPSAVQQFYPYMVEDNWLLSYASIEGIKRILYQMNRRTKGRSKMDEAVKELKEHYSEFETDFRTFFPDLQEYSDQKIKSLL